MLFNDYLGSILTILKLRSGRAAVRTSFFSFSEREKWTSEAKEPTKFLIAAKAWTGTKNADVITFLDVDVGSAFRCRSQFPGRYV